MSGLTQFSANDNCQVLMFIYLYKCQAVMLKTGGGETSLINTLFNCFSLCETSGLGEFVFLVYSAQAANFKTNKKEEINVFFLAPTRP